MFGSCAYRCGHMDSRDKRRLRIITSSTATTETRNMSFKIFFFLPLFGKKLLRREFC